MVWRSQNAKTGATDLSTYRTQGSCPPTCALYHAGCYAENRGSRGRPSPFGQAERGTILGTDYGPLIEALRRLGRQSVVRFNVAGDYLLEDGTPDMAYIEATNEAPGDVLSYTHAWRTLEPRWFMDKTRPNASCDSVSDVRDALAAGWAAVISDPDGRYAQGTKVDGVTCVTCPYETSKRQCVDCRLCARTNRPSLVVFPVHGSRRRIAAEALLRAA
jgi:hypothetical protein